MVWIIFKIVGAIALIVWLAVIMSRPAEPEWFNDDSW